MPEPTDPTSNPIPEPKPEATTNHPGSSESIREDLSGMDADNNQGITFEPKPPIVYRPGMVVGVLGGGQLGRMLALAGLPLGVRFRFFDPSPDAIARDVGELRTGDFLDRDAISAFASGCDVVTFEFENVPVDAAHWSDIASMVHPAPLALAVGQDRSQEKQWFQRVGLPVAPYQLVDTADALLPAFDALMRGDDDDPNPKGVVIKTCRGGYDGKGQVVVRHDSELSHAWSTLTHGRRPGGTLRCIMERLVPFDSEVSLVCVRAQDGEFDTYPLTQNTHQGGILRRSIAPALGVPEDVREQALAAARELTSCFAYVGVLAIEFFLVKGRLLANELAPRVHNSGHWTMDGAVASQFENHVRAICGLPLAPCALRPGLGACAMVNLIGGASGVDPPVAQIACLPAAHVHMYGKEPRNGRKLGHVNCTGPSHKIAGFHADRVAALLEH